MKQEMLNVSNLCIKCENNECEPLCFDVLIKDMNNNVVFHKIQTSNEYVHYNIEGFGEYQIRIIPLTCKQNPKAAYRWITINPKCKNMQFFIFFRICPSAKYVLMNFTLTDAKYKNFPIQKGVIYLWRRFLP